MIIRTIIGLAAVLLASATIAESLPDWRGMTLSLAFALMMVLIVNS